MSFEKSVLKLMCFSRNTFYVWKREDRPIISLIEKYFTEEDIEEFLNTGKIHKFDNLKSEFLFSNQLLYVKSFAKSKSLLSEPHVKDKFKDFYFSFLLNFESIDIPFSIDTLGIKSLLTNYLYLYQMDKIKENIKIVKINEKFENLKLDIDDAINSTIGTEKKELKKFKENLQKQELTEKEKFLEKIFSENEDDLRMVIQNFNIFDNWNNNIYYFLKIVKKDDFNYFINSKSDELLYQAIGYLVYSLSPHNINMEEKLQIIYSAFHYFIFNKDFISPDNVKSHILKRLENNKSFSEIDKEISHKYITSDFPDNLTNNFENKEMETVIFEDLIKKGS